MTIQNQEIEEVKSSFGVNAEVADAIDKKAVAPGKVQKNGDQESESIPQGSSLPKTKISMINAVMSKLSQMKKEDVEQQLASMEEDEQIDELDASTLKSYKAKAVDSGRSAMITGNKPTLAKRTAGVKNANKKLGEAEDEGHEDEKEDKVLIAKMMKKKMKKEEVTKISRDDIDVSEDIAAAFSGSDLSEEFKAQATEIFETAVVSSVNMKLAEMAEKAEQEYAEEMQSIEEGLTTKIDEYLDYVVEQWMEENRLAVESGLRSEVTENFLSGLRNLFAENWIDIPEEKVEVVEELAGEVEHLTASLDEEMQKNIELKKQVEKFEREIAFVDVSEGLTEMQIAKFESLAEAVDYEDSESYKERLETIRSSFFESRSQDVTESRTTLDEEFIETSEISEKKLEPNMQMYSAAISRSVKK
jgi:hypothetical protein